jgi:hypothetical protein
LHERLAAEGRATDDDLFVLLEFNRVLNEPGRTLTFFDKIKSSASPPRQILDALARALCNDFLQARRYHDFVQVERHCMLTVWLFLATAEFDRDFPRTVDGRPAEDGAALAERAKQRATRTYQALLILGRVDTATKLKKWILRPEPDGQTYMALIEAAIAAKKTGVARTLVSEARTKLPPSEMTPIDDMVRKHIAP